MKWCQSLIKSFHCLFISLKRKTSLLYNIKGSLNMLNALVFTTVFSAWITLPPDVSMAHSLHVRQISAHIPPHLRGLLWHPMWNSTPVTVTPHSPSPCFALFFFRALNHLSTRLPIRLFHYFLFSPLVRICDPGEQALDLFCNPSA